MNNKQVVTNQYLTDAAKKMDSIMHGTVYENGKCLKDTLLKEEIRELKSEIGSMLVQKVKEHVQLYKRTAHLIGIEDEYEAELILELYKNLYRFNNERYMQVKKNYCIETFLKFLSKRALRNIKLQTENYNEYTLRKIRKVQRERHIVADELHKSIEDITPHEVLKYGKTNDFSLEELKMIFMDMQECVYMDSYEEYGDAYKTDEYLFCEQQIVKEFKTFIDSMRPMQQLIFLQYFGYLGKPFENMSITELVLEPVFVEVVKVDIVGRRHIKVNGNNVEVVDVRFILATLSSDEFKKIKVLGLNPTLLHIGYGNMLLNSSMQNRICSTYFSTLFFTSYK